MENSMKKRVITIIAFLVGVICFFIVFIPTTRLSMVGNATGDSITMILTIIGVLLSSIGLKMYGKSAALIISLILSFSFPIFFMLIVILLLTGQIDFAP